MQPTAQAVGQYAKTWKPRRGERNRFVPHRLRSWIGTLDGPKDAYAKSLIFRPLSRNLISRWLVYPWLAPRAASLRRFSARSLNFHLSRDHIGLIPYISLVIRNLILLQKRHILLLEIPLL